MARGISGPSVKASVFLWARQYHRTLGSGAAARAPVGGSFRASDDEDDSWPLKPQAREHVPKSFEHRETASAESVWAVHQAGGELPQASET